MTTGELQPGERPSFRREWYGYHRGEVDAAIEQLVEQLGHLRTDRDAALETAQDVTRELESARAELAEYRMLHAGYSKENTVSGTIRYLMHVARQKAEREEQAAHERSEAMLAQAREMVQRQSALLDEAEQETQRRLAGADRRAREIVEAAMAQARAVAEDLSERRKLLDQWCADLDIPTPRDSAVPEEPVGADAVGAEVVGADAVGAEVVGEEDTDPVLHTATEDHDPAAHTTAAGTTVVRGPAAAGSRTTAATRAAATATPAAAVVGGPAAVVSAPASTDGPADPAIPTTPATAVVGGPDAADGKAAATAVVSGPASTSGPATPATAVVAGPAADTAADGAVPVTETVLEARPAAPAGPATAVLDAVAAGPADDAQRAPSAADGS